MKTAGTAITGRAGKHDSAYQARTTRRICICPTRRGENKMTAVDAAATGGMSDAEHDKQLRRALIASTVGTTIEWYDFLLYGTVTGLVFGKLFFPGSDPIVGVLEAFGVFFIGFVGRPIGAAIFGHYGDRIGRKATLIV